MLTSDEAAEKDEGLALTPSVSIFINTASDTIVDVIFSPNKARTAAVIYKNKAARFYDLELTDLDEASDAAELGSKQIPHSFLDDDCELFVPCAVPASAIAFRPGSTDEVALALKDDNDYVYRLNPRTQKNLEPVSAVSPSALAYSHNGKILAVGSFKGIVYIYLLEGHEDEPKLLGQAKIGSSVHCLCFEKDDAYLRIVSENNAYLRLDLKDYESPTWERDSLNSDEGLDENLLKAKIACCCPSTGLLAFAGKGSEIWVFNPEYGQGKIVSLQGMQEVTRLQFLPDREKLLVFGENVVEIISFERNCLNLPETSDSGDFKFVDPNLASQIITAWQYDNLVCLARPLLRRKTDIR